MSINYSLTAISANSNKNISDTTPFSITQNFTTNHLDLSRIKKWTLTKTADGWGVVNFILLKENSKISLHFNIRDTTTVIDYNDGGFRGGVFYNDIHNLPNPSNIFISFHVVDGWKIEYGVNKEIKFENKLAISSVDEIMDTPVIVSTPSNMVSVSTPVILEKNISLSYSVPDNSYCTISSGIITPIGSSESVGNSVIVTATLSEEGISTSLTATHTINFLKTPAYIGDITRDEIFYSSIGSTYTPPLSSVPTESSFIPNLVSPNFKYSISYLSNQEYAEANVPVATISNDSSYLSNIVGTGMCYYTVTVPANEAEFLDTVVVTFHFLLVRPGYIIGPSADLTDAVIQNYDLSGVNFSNCNLTNAKIINCLLENANFTNAVFTNTIFTYNKITDSTKLTNATFNGLISSNNSGKTTQITSNYEIKGGRIVQEGTVFLSLTFYLESPEIIPDSGINTTTPYNGDGHYKVVNDGLAINGRIETAGKMETNLIIKTLNVRYQITQVGPGAKYMFEVIVTRTYSQGIYFNQMYIRGINTTTNTITTLPNTLDQQTFAVAYKLDLPLPVGYVINGSYLFGPNMNLSGTYFDNTVNPKPDLSNLPSNLTLNNIVISSSSTLRGKQWTQPSIYTHAPMDVYVSSTGKVIAYVNGYQKDRGILYSKNYGASYNETSFATYRGWNTICGTATGDIIYVFANNIMTKNGTTIKTKLAYTRDKFATLTYINTPSASSFFGGNTTNYIEKLRCSSDGKLLIGTERGPVGSTDIRVPHIYRSSDYGNNWTDIVLSSLKGCATGLAMSKDGKYVYVTVDGTSFDTRPNTGTGGVWRSNDYGLTFTQVYFETKIYKVECNATGEIVIFSDSTTSSRISWNYGTNWTPLSAVSSDKIWSACISETGNSIWVGYYDSFGGNFSNSLDYGRTWTYSITPTGQWTWFGVNCLGCNSDASIVVSGGYGGLLGQYREYSTDNDTIIEGWTLSGTSLQNGYFANVCFSNCNCNSTNFSGSNLENASFKITSSTPKLNELVALYQFDSNSNDSSPNNNHLTNVGNVLFNTSDFKVGSASAVFNGSNYFEIANDGRFSPPNFTISFWIKPVKSTGNHQSIASCRGNGWTIYINSSDHLEFWTGLYDGAGNHQILYSNFGQLNVWTHLAFTFNGSTNELIVYMNGAVLTTKTRRYTIHLKTSLRIGAGANESTPQFYLGNGTLLDDFRIYKTVLSVFQINEIALLASPTSSIATLQNAKLTNCQLDNLTITGYDLSMNMNVAGLDFDGSQIKYITTYFLNETGSGPVNMLSVSLGRDSNKYDYKMITDNSIGRFMAGPGMCLKELTLGNANFSDTNLSNIDILETNLASTSLNRVSMRQGNLFYSSSNTILPSGYRAVKQPVTFNTVNALHFNGTTNFVDFNANIVELGKSSFTIECWIKTNETEMGILNCQNNNTTWEYGEKSLYIDTNGIPVFVGYGCDYIYSTVAINDNKWHHIAVTWSYTGGTSGTGTFYIDGINKTNNDIQILKIPSVPMTASSSVGLTASASSVYAVDWLPWYAFDLNTNTGWHSNVTYNGNGTYQGSVTTTDVNDTVHYGEWLQLQLGTAVKLHTFYITPRDGLHLARSPTSFVVLGSNDGSAWNIVHEELNKSWTNKSETFIVSRPTSSYSYYRMVVKKTGIAQGAQPDSVQIMEWVLNRTSVSKYKHIANTLNAGTFVFGKPNYSETKKFFKGAVCELRIWNVARSASEILQNYRRVLFGNEYGLVAYNRFNQGIAEGSNSGVITVTNNKTTGGYTGTLSGNFTLSGTVSNWVSGISMNTNTGYIVGKGFDLSGVDARGLNFELSDISAVNFTNALFSGVKSGNMKTNELTTLPNEYRILNGYFVGPFIDLSGANLSSSILTDSNLTGVNLTNALLYRAVSGGIRNTATVDGVQYTQLPTMPSGYGLTRGYIVGPEMILTNVDLSGFDFTNVNLSGTNFTGSSLTYVISGNTTSSESTILPDASYAFLSGFIVGPRVNLSYKNISGVKFSTATAGGFTLSGSLFVGANFTGSDFSGVILDGIDFTNANFTRTSSRNIPQPVVPITSFQSSDIHTNGIVALYRFDGNSIDTSPNKNHITNVGNVTFNTSDYKVGSASALFNGSNYFEIENDGRFSPVSFTISCWIKPVSTSETYQSVASCRKGDFTGWIIYIAPNNALEFWSGAGGVWNSQTIYPNFGTLNAWTHVAFTFEQATNQFIAYVNGSSIVTSNTIVYIRNLTTSLRIGAGINELTTPQYFLKNGTLLDDFRIYSISLSASQIYGLASSGYTIRNGYIIGANVDMSFTNLTGMDISNTVLTGVNFTGATLNGVKSGGGGITVLSTSQPTLPPKYKVLGGFLHGPNVDLTGANLSNLAFDSSTNAINWSSANLTNAVFTNMRSGWIEIDSDFSGPILSPPYVYNRRVASNPSGGFIIGPSVNLSSVNFTNFDLRNVLDVANVNFTGTTFTNVKTSGAIASPSSVGNFPTFSAGSGYVLYRGFIIGPNVNMSGTNLSTFVFGTNATALSQGSTAALSGVNFSYANLTSANLLGSTVNGTNFTGSNFLRTRTGGLSIIPTLPNAVIQPIFDETNWHYLLSKDGVESSERWFEGVTYYIGLANNITHAEGGVTNQTMTRSYNSALPQYAVIQPINANTGYWIANCQSEVFHKNSNSFISGTQILNQYVMWNSQTQVGKLHGNLYYLAYAPLNQVLWSKTYTNPVVSRYGSTINGTPIDIPSGYYTLSVPRVDWENIDVLPDSGKTATITTRMEAKINGEWTVLSTWGHWPPSYTSAQFGLSLSFQNHIFSQNQQGSLPIHTQIRFVLTCTNGTIRQKTAGAEIDAGAYSLLSGVSDTYAQFKMLLYGGANSPVVTPYSTTPTLVTLNLPISAPYDISCFNYSSYYVDIIFSQLSGGYSGNIIKLFFNEGSRSNLKTTVAEPLSHTKLISGNIFENSRLYYNNVPISTYSSLYFSEEIYWDNPVTGYDAGDSYSITFGSTQSISLLFMFWQGYSNNGFSGAGIYLLKDGLTLTKSNTLPNGAGPRQWFTVSVTYTRSVTNTWQVNIDGVSGLTYSDSNALSWAESAGSLFSMSAASGNGLRMSLFVRKLYLASTTASNYKYVTTTVSGGYIIGPGVDLTQTNMQGADFTNINFNNVLMRGANILNTSSENVVYDASSALPSGYTFITNNANSSFIMGPNLNFAGKFLNGSAIRNVDLTNTIFTNASFISVKSSGITFDSSSPPIFTVGSGYKVKSGFLIGPRLDLSGESMIGIDLSGENLTNTSFLNADLSGANLFNSNLSFATFEGASFFNIMSGGRINYEFPPVLPSSSYKLVSNGYSESNSKFQRYIVGPNANCRGADFSGTFFDRVDLSNVDFSGANFTNVSSGIMRNQPILSSLPSGFGLVSGINTQNVQSQDPNYNNALYFVGPYANLSNAFLKNAEIKNVNITGINFTGADFNGLSTSGLIGTPQTFPSASYFIRGGYIFGPTVNLSGGVFTDLDISNSILTGANFTNSNFTNTNLNGCNILNVKLGGSIMIGAKTAQILYQGYDYGDNLSGQDPSLPTSYRYVYNSNTNVGYIIGPYVDISGSDLRGSDLAYTNLTGINLFGADIRNVRSGNITITGGVQPTFTPGSGYKVLSGYIIGPYVDLRGINFTDQDFSGTNLTGTLFTNSIFVNIKSGNIVASPDLPVFPDTTFKLRYGYIFGPNVDLSNSDLSGMDLSGLILTNARMQNTNFTNVRSGRIIGTTAFIRSGYVIRNGSAANDGYIIGDGVDLSGATLTVANLANVYLTNANLTNVTFSNATLLNGVKSGGNLRYNDKTLSTMPTNYTIRGTYIVGPRVDLSGANLTLLDLSNTVLTGANMSNAIFTNMRSGGIQMLTATPITFSSAETYGSEFGYKYLNGYIVGPGVDLTGSNFSGVTFSSVDLSGVKLSGSNLSSIRSLNVAGTPASLPAGYKVTARYIIGPGLDMSGYNFTNGDFSGADITGSILINANFTNTSSGNVTGSAETRFTTTVDPVNIKYQLSNGYIVGPKVNLSNGDLSGVNVSGINLTDATLFNTKTGKIISNNQTIVPNSNYTIVASYIIGPNVNLTGVDFSGVDLRYTNLTNVNFSGANLFNVRSGFISGTPQQLPTFYSFIGGFIIGPNTDLSGADLSGGNLENVSIENADLTNANFYNVSSGGIQGTPRMPLNVPYVVTPNGYIVGPNVNLNNATMPNIDLRGLTLTNAIMTNMDFTNTKFGNNIGVPRILSSPYIHVQTTLSGGFIVGPFVDISYGNFSYANLATADLTGAKLSNATFFQTMSGRMATSPGTPASLPSGYSILSTTSSGGYLVGPNVNLNDANFSGESTVLTGLNITNALMDRVRFDGAKMGGGNLIGPPSTINPLYRFIQSSASGGYIIGPNIDLSGANFLNTDISFVYVDGINFTNTNFKNTKSGRLLVRAPGTGTPESPIQSTIFSPTTYRLIFSTVSGGYIIGPEVNLSDANFTDSDISATFLTGVNMSNARLDNMRSGLLTANSTTLPTLPVGYKYVVSTVSGGYIIGPNQNLVGANLTGADLSFCNFYGCNTLQTIFPSVASSLYFARSGGIPNTSVPAFLPNPYKFITNAVSGGYIVGPFSDLSGANLESSILTDTDILGVNFTNARLKFARSGGIPNTSVPAVLPSPYKFITNAASGGYIVGPFSDLSGANLESSVLTDTDISGANFTNARLRFTRSGGIPNTSVPATLPSPYKFITNAVSGGYIVGPFSDLSGANLESSILTNTDLSGANFTNARLRFTRSGGIPNTSVPAILPTRYKFITNAASGGYIVGPFSDLSGANLESSILTDTDILGADFTNARLKFARSGGIPNTSVPAILPSPYKFITNASSGGYIVGPFSDLSGANFESSILTDTDISGANFTNARLHFTRSGGIPNTSVPAVLPSPYKFITNSASGGYIVGPFSDLSGSNLESSILTDTDISGADLTNSRLKFVRSGGIPNTSIPATLPSPYKFITNEASGGYIVGPFSDLSGANFEASILTGTDISSANLTNARLINVKTGLLAVNGANGGAPASLPPTYSFIQSAITASGGYIVGTGVDLSGAVLTGTDLSGTVFTNVNIQNANLGNTNLVNVKSGGVRGVPAFITSGYAVVNDNSTGAYIIGRRVNLSGANLSNYVLTGLDVTGANMFGAVMLNAKTGPNLIGPPAVFPSSSYNYVVSSGNGGFLIGPGVDVSGANLSNTDLSNYDFKGANLTGVDLSGCILTNVKSGQITGQPKLLPPSYVFMNDNSFGGFIVGPNVDLSGANLTNCQFTGLNIAGASFTNAIMRNIKSGGGMIGPPSSLPEKYRYVYEGLSGDNTGGYFIGPGVDLSGARLTNLNTSGNNIYNLDGVYLTDANITNANFSGSSMKNVKSGGIVGVPQALPSNFAFVVSASGGYLIGPESDLQNANLNDVVLTGMNITQADLSGATFINTRSGGLVGPPRTLTGGYYFVQRPGTGVGTSIAPDAYILGPGVNLSAANLSGTNLTNFDMSGANLSNVTFTNTTMTNVNIFNANLTSINPGTPLENNFTVKQNLQLLKNQNNRSISRIRLTDCSAADIDVVDIIPKIWYDPSYNRIYDYIRPLSTPVFIPDNSGNSNLSRLRPTDRVFYIPSGPGESFYVDSSATITPIPVNTQSTQYYHDVSGGRIIEKSTGNTIRSILVNGKVFLVFGASMLGVSITDVYRALGFPEIYETYSYYGARNLTLPEKVSQVYTVTGNGNISLNWVPSFSDGKPRLGYVIEYTDIEPVAQLYVPWVVYSDKYPLTNVTIMGLTNSKTYYFRVAAVNVIGTGAYSDIVTSVPGTRPDDVSTLFITSDASLSAFIAEWSDPFNQGYPIQTYTIRYRPAQTLDPWLYTVINADNPLLVRTIQGTKTVLSYPLRTSANSGLVPSLPPPAVQTLYQIQISATNILGTNEFANPAPIINTTLLDTDSMTVVPPNVVFSRIGTLPQKVSMSSIIPTIIPDSGGKKVKLSWLVPTPYSYVPYAYAIKYTLLTDVSGVLVPPPANIPDASWNVISPSSFTVSYDVIRTAAEAEANTAVMTIISGLTNGQRYSFRIAALNAAGRGVYSDAIPVSIIPGSVPSVLNVLTEIAYTINTSTGGTISLYWVPPNKNGYAITNYRVRRRLNLQGDADWVTTEIAVPSGVTDTQPYRTLTTPGLVNGTVYEYQVASKNQLGWSEYSETLYAVPRKVPDPILNVSASILNKGLKVNWNTAGVNDGGYPVTSYRVQYLPVTTSTPSDAWSYIDVDGIYSSTVEISGLVNGITYRIRVLQFNAIGSSKPELSGIIEAVPGIISLPPTGLFVTIGNTRLTVFWTVPTSTGTNDVSYYYVQYKKASESDNLYQYVKNTGQTTPKQFTNANVSLVPNPPGYDAFFAVIEGLVNGTNYSVRVAAVTQVGIGQWSLPLEGIPGTVPSKVT